jgi:hypothetical protein
MRDRAYNAVFTAETLEPRVAANGNPYLRARGTIANRERSIRRTVMVHGAGYGPVTSEMRIGVPLKLRGFYREVQAGGKRGGQFFSAIGLASDYAAKRSGPVGAGASEHPMPTRADAPAAETPDAARVGATPTHPTESRIRSAPDGSFGNLTQELEVPEPDAETLILLEELRSAPRPAMPTLEELADRAERTEHEAVLPDLALEPFPPAPRTISGHVREGYHRRQRHGPQSSLVKIVWIDACVVKGGAKRRQTARAEDPNQASLLIHGE